MTNNAAILRAAHAIIRGQTPAPKDHGLCLALVRIILERAFWGGAWALYDRHRSHIVERDSSSNRDPWARDMERSLTQQGMSVTVPRLMTGPDPGRYVDLAAAEAFLQPGDLLFRWDTARNAHGDYVGHVAVLLEGGLVLENVRFRTGAFEQGSTKITWLGSWPVTTIIRFNPS